VQERFTNLPDWPYEGKYIQLRGFEQFEIHYIDEGGSGDPNQPTYFILHGNPSWLYLYRKMIPVFLQSGGRVVGMDMIGFGKSCKPENDSFHKPMLHRDSLINFFRAMKMNDNVTMVMQDWGGILGLTLPLESDIGSKLKRVILMNTCFCEDHFITKGFRNWLKYSNSQPELDVAKLFQRSAGIDKESAAAYNAPFPSVKHRAAVRVFPNLLVSPVEEFRKISTKAQLWWSNSFKGDAFVACGSQDPVLGIDVMQKVSKILNTTYFDFPQGGHFTQENGRWIAMKALQHFGDLPKSNMFQVDFVDRNVAIMKMDYAPVNSMSTEFCREFLSTLQDLEKEHACHSVIITSSQRAFSAGLDIKVLAYGSYEELVAQFIGLNSVVEALYKTRLGVVFAINGSAPAGGTVMALGGDYRLMCANDPSAKRPKYMMGLNESQLNMPLTTWLPHHVARVVGPNKAQRILEWGEFFTSEEALKEGLVDEVIDPSEIENRALQVAKKYAKVGQNSRTFFKSQLRADFLSKLKVKEDAQRSAKLCMDDDIRKLFQKMLNRGKRKKKSSKL